eukprot:SAG11_NODE_3194_length_2620_cov_2.356208_4_plen_193_part_00
MSAVQDCDESGDLDNSIEHLHQVTVHLSWSHPQEELDGTKYVAFAFDVKVFGVTAYKFYNRFSLLREVHRKMESAGCLVTMRSAFPKKGYMIDYSSDAMREKRGCAQPPFLRVSVRFHVLKASCWRREDLLRYYTELFTNDDVLGHPKTKSILGFDITGWSINSPLALESRMHLKSHRDYFAARAWVDIPNL